MVAVEKQIAITRDDHANATVRIDGDTGQARGIAIAERAAVVIFGEKVLFKRIIAEFIERTETGIRCHARARKKIAGHAQRARNEEGCLSEGIVRFVGVSRAKGERKENEWGASQA